MLADAVELIKLIKQTALDAVNASKPVEMCFGSVKKDSPIQVLVEQKILLGEKQLVLIESVKESGLAAGDEVVLIRQQGGQKYLIAGKIV